MSFQGYSYILEYYFLLIESEHISSRHDERIINVQIVLKSLKKHAKIFELSRARYRLWNGLYMQLTGKKRRARQEWQKGLTLARDYEMPYDAALIHYHLGRHLDKDDPTRNEHLENAIEIFTKCGAAYELERSREALRH